MLWKKGSAPAPQLLAGAEGKAEGMVQRTPQVPEAQRSFQCTEEHRGGGVGGE